jgi:PHS family inorganic phosphate transporter-like MFS transporter
MLAYVYWPDKTDNNHSLAINQVTLGGSIIGMLVFGHLADRWGRKRLYGLELVIVIVATLGLTQASAGYNQKSMKVYPWIIFWRGLLGIGIGAEYPLSALIASEWTSSKSRGRMLAAVFLMQPIGQLFAYAVSYIALVYISKDSGMDPNSPDWQNHDKAAPVIDSIWRCVIGVGGFPALIAIVARWSIPETPRYLLEVENDRPRAVQSAETVYPSQSHKRPGDIEMGAMKRRSKNLKMATAGTAEKEKNGQTISHPNGANDTNTSDEALSPHGQDRQPSGTLDLEKAPDLQVVPNSLNDRQDSAGSKGSGQYKARKKNTKNRGLWALIWTDFWHEWNTVHKGKNYGYILAGTSLCWCLLDISFYGIGLADSPRTLAKIWAATPTNITEKYATTATSSGFTTASDMLDWESNLLQPNQTIYDALKGNAVRALYTVPISSVLGCVFILIFINYIPRATALAWTFFTLALLFAITGGSLFAVYETNHHDLTVVFYAFALFVFNAGPNTLTFMLPAELFPTKYRGTCYGIAAASGKAGALMIQGVVFKAKTTRPNNGSQPLAIMLCVFAPLMLLGALVAWIWIPEVQERDKYAHKTEEPEFAGEKEDHEPEPPQTTKTRTFIDDLRFSDRTLEKIAENPTYHQKFGFMELFKKKQHYSQLDSEPTGTNGAAPREEGAANSHHQEGVDTMTVAGASRYNGEASDSGGHPLGSVTIDR